MKIETEEDLSVRKGNAEKEELRKRMEKERKGWKRKGKQARVGISVVWGYFLTKWVFRGTLSLCSALCTFQTPSAHSLLKQSKSTRVLTVPHNQKMLVAC